MNDPWTFLNRNSKIIYKKNLFSRGVANFFYKSFLEIEVGDHL